MKFIRYSKFKGFDVNGLNLGDVRETGATANFQTPRTASKIESLKEAL